MATDYKAEKAAKKKTGQKALWMLIVLLVVVLAMVIKIMLANNITGGPVSTGLPSNDEAYTVAKEFIIPTLKSSTADFNDAHYQFGKKGDSVYTIQSTVDSRNENNEKVTINFRITLKYNGGQATKTKNWDLINLDTN
jgi:hypothetical protein